MKQQCYWIDSLVLLGILGLWGCKTTHEVSPPEPMFSITLIHQEVHFVELDWPNTVVNLQGQKQQYKQSYLVKLVLDYPKINWPRVDFFIGDYQVPEYGGTEDGLYFKIYEPALIRQLAGKQLLYRVGGHDVQNLNQTFKVPTLSELPLEKEYIVLRRQK